MRKRTVSVLLTVILLFSMIGGVSAAQPAQKQAADALHALGLFQGVGLLADGTPDYALDRAPTRQEAVTMLVRLLGRETEAKTGKWQIPFGDVADWAKPYVGYAYQNGLTKGMSTTEFGGNGQVTASQYLTFVLRALGYSSGADFAWDRAWELSDSLGITSGEYGASSAAFLRGDVALISYHALSARMKGRQTTLQETLPKQSEKLMVHFIDVGQADCILVQQQGHFMLVDAGNNADGPMVVQYLKNQGVTSLDYVIGTHPHEDHVGGLDDVIRAFPIQTLILSEKGSTTKTYESVLDAALAKNLAVTTAKSGQSYTLGGAAFTLLAPNGNMGDNLNNWSVGLRLVYGSTSFVMCGDAETQAEAAILQTGLPLKADVLKLGHHGSSTSSSDAFLDAVSPTWGVISCGLNNDYGHPHASTLTKLKNRGISYFRTDLQGTVIAASDGKTITWNVSPQASVPAPVSARLPEERAAG